MELVGGKVILCLIIVFHFLFIWISYKVQGVFSHSVEGSSNDLGRTGYLGLFRVEDESSTFVPCFTEKDFCLQSGLGKDGY